MVNLTTYTFLIFSLFLSIVVKTSEGYSIPERIKIVELYYTNNCSVSLTQKGYRKHFNVGTAPSSETIRNMVKLFEERGSVKDLPRSGRQCKETNGENALLVRESLNKKSQLSLRRRAKELCIKRTTFAHIINQELYLFPYKMQVAQGIEATDKVKRLEYVNEIKNLVEQNEHFIGKLIMSSEAIFYLNGLIEKHNCKIWGMSNPRAVDRSEREGKKVTVWCGITSSRVIGPYFFENESGNQVTVNAQNYRNMIQNYLIPELEDTKRMWFVQDEYPAHNDRKTINLLKTIIDNIPISMNSIVK